LPLIAAHPIAPRACLNRKTAVARSAKTAKTAADAGAPDSGRPPEPRPYGASKEELLKFYREMLLIRRFEERAGQLYGLGLIGGFCHLYIGQEAVAVGLQSAMRVGKDSVITGYRDHGHMLAYGIDPKLIMAELTGREAGISKGKGGSMHMFSVDHGFYGGHGIVGAQVSLGTGLAFGHKYRDDGGVCLTYFGDGAANQGQVYESFNMAKLWKLPVIYAIENNQYAMGTSVARSASEPDFYKRGTSFRIPGLQVDGMDVLAVRGAAEVALEWTRGGNGPIILELKTYRYRGHSMSDPAKYRSRDEVQSYRESNDPISNAAAALEKLGVGEEELKAIDKEIKNIVVEAAKFAEDAPDPEPAELYTDVLVGSY
jgi:pyruvate dehydrogenase E1 component alpha subunit